MSTSLLSWIGGNGTDIMKSSSGLHASLQSVQTNVLIANPDLTLVYANEKAITTLKEIEKDIMDSFGVRVEEMIGGSIHRFHKDARRIENILKDPRALPHTQQSLVSAMSRYRQT